MDFRTEASLGSPEQVPSAPLSSAEQSNATFETANLINQLPIPTNLKSGSTKNKLVDKIVARFKPSKFSTSELKAMSMAKYETKSNYKYDRSFILDKHLKPIANDKWIAMVGYSNRKNVLILLDRETGKENRIMMGSATAAFELTNKKLTLIDSNGELTSVDLKTQSVKKIDSFKIPIFEKPISIQTSPQRITVSSQSGKNTYSLYSCSVKDDQINLESELTVYAQHVSVYDNLVVYVQPDGKCIMQDIQNGEKIHYFQIPDKTEKYRKLECCRLIGSKLCVEYSTVSKRSTIKIFDVENAHHETLVKRLDLKATSWMRKVKGHYFLGNEELIYHPRMRGYDLQTGKRIGRRPSFQWDAEGERQVMGNLDANTGKYAEWKPGLHLVRVHEFKPLKENNPFLRAIGHTIKASAFLTSTPFFLAIVRFQDFRYKTAYHTTLATHYFKVYKDNYKKKHR
jgi:hypothetical protein